MIRSIQKNTPKFYVSMIVIELFCVSNNNY